MSEAQKAPEPAKRTTQDIQREYQEACFKIGDLAHKIDVYNRDTEMLKSTIRDLDLEFTKLRQVELAAQAEKQKDASLQVVPNEQPKEPSNG